MTQTTSADWELAIVLPLGAVAGQLRRIEERLRLLDMKALEFARQSENRTLRGLIDAMLENINDALGAITGLVADIDADIRPRSSEVNLASIKDEVAPLATQLRVDDARSSREAVASEYPARSSRAELDD